MIVRTKRILKVLILAIVAIPLFGFIVMSLWNWLMPTIFGLHAITFWQGFGLLFLARILFGGFAGRGHGGHWRHRMMERWEQMSPEERERFREAMAQRWGEAK